MKKLRIGRKFYRLGQKAFETVLFRRVSEVLGRFHPLTGQESYKKACICGRIYRRVGQHITNLKEGV